MKFKKMYEAKTLSLKTIVKEIVKQLQSSDFGMGKKPPNDGNGRAFLKGNNIIIQDPFFYHPLKSNIESTKKMWSNGGTYHKYFEEKFPGIMFKVINVQDIEESYKKKKTFEGMPAFMEYTVEVSI